MLRPVLNQYGTLFVPYIPKCPIQVCHTSVNTEYNNNEQNKTQETRKTAKICRREVKRTSCGPRTPMRRALRLLCLPAICERLSEPCLLSASALSLCPAPSLFCLRARSSPSRCVFEWAVGLKMSSSEDNDVVEEVDTPANSASAVEENPPPRKKGKRLQKYRREWEEENAWLDSVSGDV